tara:strand:- start:19 stop:426 length:408 start_codon:yes stop_codon:yes gene_type:complete
MDEKWYYSVAESLASRMNWPPECAPSLGSIFCQFGIHRNRSYRQVCKFYQVIQLRLLRADPEEVKEVLHAVDTRLFTTINSPLPHDPSFALDALLGVSDDFQEIGEMRFRWKPLKYQVHHSRPKAGAIAIDPSNR